MMGAGLISCSTIPSGLEIPMTERVVEPSLNFQDEGQHCLDDSAVNDLARYVIDVRSYQETTEAIIYSLNSL